MKLYELEIGREYAIDRSADERSVRYIRPCRARFAGFTMQRLGKQQQRRCRFVLLEEPEWATNGQRLTGTVIEIRAQSVWWSWAMEEERRQALREKTEAREANAIAMREALATLGIHDRRHVETDSDPHLFTVTLSLYELVKLADRARHLVELERLVYEFRREVKPRGWISEQVYTWAADHDFSMLLSEQPPSQP